MGQHASFRIKTTLLTLSFLALIPGHANAGVNLQDGSFISKWTDLQAGSFQVERVYESRSVHRGLFGFGWCSTLDFKLQTLNDTLQLDVCGIRHSFTRTSNDVFTSKKAELGQIVKSATAYEWTRSDGARARFANGRVQAWREAGRSAWTRFEYGPTGLPRFAATGEGLRVRYEVDALEERIVGLELSNGQNVKYKYQGENLTEVKNAWNNTYRHFYSALSNLTKTEYPDGTKIETTYNELSDQISSLIDRNGCREHYAYKTTRLANDLEETETTAIRAPCKSKPARILQAKIQVKTGPTRTITSVSLTTDGKPTSLRGKDPQ